MVGQAAQARSRSSLATRLQRDEAELASEGTDTGAHGRKHGSFAMNFRAIKTRVKAGRLWVQPVGDRRSQAILTPHFLPKTGETGKRGKTSLNETDSLVGEEMKKKIMAMRTVGVQLSDVRAGRALNRRALPPAPPNPGSSCAPAMFYSTSTPKGTFLMS